jgi:diguanylate cyclase (GGDEF)-like protein
MNFAILPNLVALAVLVAVFWAISRKATSDRLHLWLIGWILILLHFAAEFFSAAKNPWGLVAEIAEMNSLVLAAVAFLISVSGLASTKRQVKLALCLGAPTVAYATGAVGDIGNKFYYLGLLALTVAGILVCCWEHLLRRKAPILAIAALGLFCFAITSWMIARNTPDIGLVAILGGLYFAIALLYASAYRRATAGVVTTVVGFSLWGAVFPLGFLTQFLAPSYVIDAEAWNIPKYLVAVGMILTLFEEQIRTSRYHAYHDELTGLPNRRLLEDRLTQALTYAHRARTKLAVLQLDLDRFKEVNDTYGHRVGDLALQEVAARLATRIRAGDTLARSGGDEFTVISIVEDRKAAEALVAALELTLSAPIVIDGRDLQTGLSIGIAIYPDDGSNADQLHAAADGAMYAAKRANRNLIPEVSGQQPSTMAVSDLRP